MGNINGSDYYKWGKKIGRYEALKEVKDMITDKRADLDDVYSFCRKIVKEYEDEREDFFERW